MKGNEHNPRERLRRQLEDMVLLLPVKELQQLAKEGNVRGMRDGTERILNFFRDAEEDACQYRVVVN